MTALTSRRITLLWVDEGMYPRPFERDWRTRRVAYHRELWDLATHGPAPTERDLYPDLVFEAVAR